MNHHRLRGTWEEDHAPIPFPRAAGRDAGQASPSPADAVPEAPISDRTQELVENVEQEFGRLQLRFDEFKHLLGHTPSIEDDGPTAA